MELQSWYDAGDRNQNVGLCKSIRKRRYETTTPTGDKDTKAELKCKKNKHEEPAMLPFWVTTINPYNSNYQNLLATSITVNFNRYTMIKAIITQRSLVRMHIQGERIMDQENTKQTTWGPTIKFSSTNNMCEDIDHQTSTEMNERLLLDVEYDIFFLGGGKPNQGQRYIPQFHQ
jgi:hypothetical protein